MQILISTFSQGLIWSVLALGVFIAFKILNFADMTAEGSMALGGSICASLIARGMNPILSLIVSALASSLAGFITGLLHTKLKIQPILSGILTMIALYSVNIRIMGKANLSLLSKDTIFSKFESSLPILKENPIFAAFTIGFIVCLVVILVLSIFFKTQIGLAIRATGDNEQMMRAHGGNTNLKKIIALMISSLLCGLAGALIVQSQGYSDINMGTGTIAIALASIVIGESFVSFFKLKNKLLNELICVVLGSICYRIIICIVLNLGMNPSDLKLFTAFVTAVLLGLSNTKKIKEVKKND